MKNKIFKAGCVLFIVNGFVLLVGTAMCVFFDRYGEICVGQEGQTEEDHE